MAKNIRDVTKVIVDFKSVAGSLMDKMLLTDRIAMASNLSPARKDSQAEAPSSSTSSSRPSPGSCHAVHHLPSPSVCHHQVSRCAVPQPAALCHGTEIPAYDVAACHSIHRVPLDKIVDGYVREEMENAAMAAYKRAMEETQKDGKGQDEEEPAANKKRRIDE